MGDHIITASVTNSVERIQSALISDGLLSEHAEIYEHYEGKYAAFDLVTISASHQTQWKKCSKREFCEKYEVEYEDFFKRSEEDMRFRQKLISLRRKIDPFMYVPAASDSEKIKRKFEIEENQIKKSDLKELVENGSSEQAMASMLKKDLSILAEQYAYSNEEYICFSEFPIGDVGKADFAIFSGRSRMCVTLIEMKGADFPLLVNRSGYKSFAARIESAQMQVIEKNGYIYRNYDQFRRQMHAIRKKVEKGKRCYNSFVGPNQCLHVDPEKDIHLRYIIIGGRTVEDVEESGKRHDFENITHPPIHLETWDSWLAKLSRE